MRWTVVTGLREHPWVVSTALVWWLASTLLWARLPRDRRTAWSLLFWCALGLLVAVTLTPSLNGPPRGTVPGSCLMTWPRTGFGLWAPNPERRWNVLLGVPLGVAALCWPVRVWTAPRPPGTRRPAWSAAPLAAPLVALVVPVAVEFGQSRLPSLGRLCAVVDVVDNASGVLVGFMIGAVVAMAQELSRSSPRRA